MAMIDQPWYSPYGMTLPLPTRSVAYQYMTLNAPMIIRGHRSRRPRRGSARSAQAAETSPANPNVIGSRSQTRRALSGARWYQAEPKLVRNAPRKNTRYG